MLSVVALGGVASRVADKFDLYPQYKIFVIDHETDDEFRNISYEETNTKSTYKIKKMKTHEETESQEIKLPNNITKNLTKNVLLITSGASMVSAVSLKVLKQIQALGKSTTVLYIQPERELLGKTKRLHERVIRNVLQQYARSGLLERIYLVSNEEVESIAGEVSVAEYYDVLNDIICSSMHMMNVFKNQKSIMSSFSDSLQAYRICTYGVLNPDTGETRPFFDIDNIRQINSYYGIPSETLKSEMGLQKKILQQVKAKASEIIEAGYGIYETSYDSSCGFIEIITSQIQQKRLD